MRHRKWRASFGLLAGLNLVVGCAVIASQVSPASADTSAPSDPHARFRITDVSPNAASDSATATGGRVERVVSSPDGSTWYAASEHGGLWKSTSAGSQWVHLDGHVPVMTRDVAVDPNQPNTVYAASLFDGRVDSISGIEVSTDGGSTWTHPASSTPPANAGCASSRTEPSAFSIGIRHDAPGHVFVGTSCGLARSTDGGATWTYLSPDPSQPASSVWSVVVQSGGPQSLGIINICNWSAV